MATIVFISYRHHDSQQQAAAIGIAIDSLLPESSVFIDANLGIGEKFPAQIERAARECLVMIVVIGPGWFGRITDSDGRPSIFSNQDWVRREVEIAIEGGKVIVPVLLDGTPMPTAAQLPVEIAALSDWQGMDYRQTSAHPDLVAIRAKVSGLPVLAAVKDKSKEKQYTPADAGPYWNEIKASTDPKRFREFLRIFETSIFAEFAAERLQTLVFEAASKLVDASERHLALNAFLAEFTSAPQVPEAKALLAATRNELAAAAWAPVAKSVRIDDILRFLDDWEDTLYAAEATRRGDYLRREAAAWRAIAGTTERAQLAAFLKAFPEGAFTEEATARDYHLAWEEVSREGDPDRLEAFAAWRPNGRFAAAAIEAARRKRDIWRADDEAWEWAKVPRRVEAIDAYLAEWPAGRHKAEAHALRQALTDNARIWETNLSQSSNLIALRAFQARTDRPASLDVPIAQRIETVEAEARRRIEREKADEGEFQKVALERSIEAIDDYLKVRPETTKREEALALRRQLTSAIDLWRSTLKTSRDLAVLKDFRNSHIWPEALRSEIERRIAVLELEEQREHEARERIKKERTELDGIRQARAPVRLHMFLQTATDGDLRDEGTALLKQWDADTEHWNRVKASKDAPLIRGYLHAHPHGLHRDAALARIKELESSIWPALIVLVVIIAVGYGFYRFGPGLFGAIGDFIASTMRGKWLGSGLLLLGVVVMGRLAVYLDDDGRNPLVPAAIGLYLLVCLGYTLLVAKTCAWSPWVFVVGYLCEFGAIDVAGSGSHVAASSPLIPFMEGKWLGAGALIGGIVALLFVGSIFDQIDFAFGALLALIAVLYSLVSLGYLVIVSKPCASRSIWFAPVGLLCDYRIVDARPAGGHAPGPRLLQPIPSPAPAPQPVFAPSKPTTTSPTAPSLPESTRRWCLTFSAEKNMFVKDHLCCAIAPSGFGC